MAPTFPAAVGVLAADVASSVGGLSTFVAVSVDGKGIGGICIVVVVFVTQSSVGGNATAREGALGTCEAVSGP